MGPIFIRAVRLPLALLTCVFALALLSGCGDDGSNETGGGAGAEERAAPSEPEPETTEQAATGAARFTGQDRRNYDEANAVCGAFPPRKVASDLGLDVDVHTSEGLVRIAEAYAADYGPSFRQAVLEGCLDGLPNP
jgi:hypothetical protein